ncbi:hypothetical protein I4U23_021039 [Adineta vaga]|nr:hypothetical protein I4U23_021039 [Adineta vaga]
MDKVSSVKNSAFGAVVALGTSGVAVLIGIFLIGVLVVSLIPVFVSDQSQEAYGDVYRISSLTIKAIYTNVSVNFTGGAILSLSAMSRICTEIFRQKNIKDFYACVATNFTAYGPSNDTSGTTALRRRRNLDDTSVYQIGDILLLFSNTCGNRRALSKWYSRLVEGENSSCTARRATACRSFITTPNNGYNGNRWFPLPAGYSQVIYTNGTGCASISISSIYNIGTSAYPLVYSRYNLTRSSGLLIGDCRYDSILSKGNLTALVDATMNPPISLCTSTIG